MASCYFYCIDKLYLLIGFLWKNTLLSANSPGSSSKDKRVSRKAKKGV